MKISEIEFPLVKYYNKKNVDLFKKILEYYFPEIITDNELENLNIKENINRYDFIYVVFRINLRNPIEFITDFYTEIERVKCRNYDNISPYEYWVKKKLQ